MATEVKSIPNFSARVAGLIWQQINGVTLSTKGPKGTLKIGPEPVQAQLQVNRVAFMQTFLYQEKPFLAKLARQYNVIKHISKTGKSRSLGMKASEDEEGRLRNNGAILYRYRIHLTQAPKVHWFAKSHVRRLIF